MVGRIGKATHADGLDGPVGRLADGRDGDAMVDDGVVVGIVIVVIDDGGLVINLCDLRTWHAVIARMRLAEITDGYKGEAAGG